MRRKQNQLTGVSKCEGAETVRRRLQKVLAERAREHADRTRPARMDSEGQQPRPWSQSSVPPARCSSPMSSRCPYGRDHTGSAHVQCETPWTWRGGNSACLQ